MTAPTLSRVELRCDCGRGVIGRVSQRVVDEWLTYHPSPGHRVTSRPERRGVEPVEIAGRGSGVSLIDHPGAPPVDSTPPKV